MMHARDIAPADHLGRQRRPIAIWQLLVWAFKTECAQLDFDGRGDDAPVGISTEWLLMQRQIMGCAIDGGGRSEPHPDADLVADALAALPQLHGGQGAAIWMAELARHDRPPAWSVPCRVRPRDLRGNRHGRSAATCHPGDIGLDGFDRVLVGGQRKPLVTARCCPVIVDGDLQAQITARRVYGQWHGILHYLRSSFLMHQNLSGYQVSRDLPAKEPWKARTN